MASYKNKRDKLQVKNGEPWFDNAMLFLEQILSGEKPLKVPLWFLNIWIQIYDLSNDFMSKAVGQQLSNFFENIIECDSKNNSNI